jgi:anti-sigma factor RsiW
MNKTEHLTQDDLILFMDGEIAAKEEQAAVQKHLLGCSDCAQRLGRLKSGSGAYEQYREQVLDPALQVPTSGWARLSHRSEL